MRVSYEREMRERAKARKCGLITIGYVTPKGGSVHTQGPATAADVRLISDTMERLYKRWARRSRRNG